MMSQNQGTGARFVRNMVMVMVALLTLAPRASRAADSGQQGIGLDLDLDLGLSPTLLTCPVGVAATTYSPGLRGTVRETSVYTQSAYDGCVTVLGEPVTSAIAYEHLPKQARSCTLLRTGQAAHTTLVWNTRDFSEVSLTLNSVDAQGLFTVETYHGTVVSGRYVGANVVRTITYVSLDLAGGCLSMDGLTLAQGFSSIVVTRL